MSEMSPEGREPRARTRLRIGELLVAHGVIREDQLAHALREQHARGRKLGQVLAELGYVSEDGLLAFLGRQLQVPVVDLRQHHCQPEAVMRLPETHARRLRAIVLADDGRVAEVGMADPTDVFAVDEVGRILQRRVQLAIVREADLLATFDRLYRRTEEISSHAEDLRVEFSSEGFDLPSLGVDDEDDAPVAKLLQSLFEDAVQVRASDIHVEPDEKGLRIRQRIDGVLQEQTIEGNRIGPAVVLRLKLVAGLDISERRVPQDGRFTMRVKGRSLDVRLATMPAQVGENVVMRILDRSGELLDLDRLEMPRDLLDRFRGLLRRPHGLLLVTGPTGSGKTTTLYAGLRELDVPGRKIITVEDPVEYRMGRMTQVQVNPRIDLTFARVLRAGLRQDPDVLMVGEMRDGETVSIGLRAAMTGHLVLSTLHTNDAVSAPLRLFDMGAEGYLVAAALRGVLAQRLVRRVCEGCRGPHAADDAERGWLEAALGPEALPDSFARGRGCSHCHGTGYAGRLGVYELLEVDEAQRHALRGGDVAAYEHSARQAGGRRPLVLSALDYARAGLTSLEEVLRVGSDVGGERSLFPAGVASGV